jgi:cytochrome c1
MKYLKYRDLTQIGLSVADIDSLRVNRSADDIISARLAPELANKAFGLVPPDLSVIAKANKNGAKHVYSILTSFHESAEGKIDNAYFPGIRMPDVLGLSVEIDPARRTVLTERANNVSAFLEWAADPRAQERKSLGYWVIGYLVILTVLLYLIKNRVWARLK